MPLQIPDTTIAAQVKPVDVMTPLSSMLNVARGAQAYESGGIDLQQKNQTNQDFQSLRDSQSQWLKPDGSIDFEKAHNAAPTAISSSLV